jgi:uncharacterized protein (DUF952 family)
LFSEGVPMSTVVYKICQRSDWAAAEKIGRYTGSADDIRDGFIHLSAQPQLAETARRYFSGQADLVLIAFDAKRFGEALRWEPSRGGDLFPHLFADLPTALALWVKPLALDVSGTPIIPEGLD